MYSLSMVVTAYNEEELIESFIRNSVAKLSKVTDDFEIVLVNDGSTDQTLPILRKLSPELSQLKIVDLKENLGTGKNYIPGFQAASKEIVFNNTVDAFFNLDDLSKMVKYLDNYDVVSGYRTDLSANNFYQKILTLGNYWLIRLFFPLKLKAYQTVQFHRNEFLKNVKIEAASSFISPELLLKAYWQGKSIKEVPIKFHPRTAGQPKGGKLKHVMRTFNNISRFWFKWVILKNYK